MVSERRTVTFSCPRGCVVSDTKEGEQKVERVSEGHPLSY